MGRLEDIIARNKDPKTNRERISVGIGLGLFVLLILVLMVFTDLGARPPETPPASGIDPGERRVEDVLLRAPPKRAPPSGQVVRP